MVPILRLRAPRAAQGPQRAPPSRVCRPCLPRHEDRHARATACWSLLIARPVPGLAMAGTASRFRCTLVSAATMHRCCDALANARARQGGRASTARRRSVLIRAEPRQRDPAQTAVPLGAPKETAGASCSSSRASGSSVGRKSNPGQNEPPAGHAALHRLRRRCCRIAARHALMDSAYAAPEPMVAHAVLGRL